MLGQVLGLLMFVVAMAAFLAVVYFLWWALGGGFASWARGQQEMRELELAQAVDAERARVWDAERARELEGWVRDGYLPTPFSRIYPAYQEFTWEWTRLQAIGYEMDHDPVPLPDGQLMVTYSVRPGRPALHVVGGGSLPGPPG